MGVMKKFFDNGGVQASTSWGSWIERVARGRVCGANLAWRELFGARSHVARQVGRFMMEIHDGDVIDGDS